MKKRIHFLFLLLFIFPAATQLKAQGLPGDDYQGRLYRLCKYWGYVKYFHSEVSTCQINWDSVLISTINQVQNAANQSDFQTALDNMIVAAGPMEHAITAPPNIADSLKINLDTAWMSDPYLSQYERDFLDSIRINFRPHDICYLVANYYAQTFNPAEGFLWFTNETVDAPDVYYPDEGHRLLYFFRCWNQVNYFQPHHDLMPQPWDSTLLEFAPQFASASDTLPYMLTWTTMFTRIGDSHSGCASTVEYDQLWGTHFPPFLVRYIENKTVVTYFIDAIPGMHVGDILISIDGISADSLRNYAHTYIGGSNETTRQRDISTRMMRGFQNAVRVVTFEDSTGSQYTLNITWDKAEAININHFYQPYCDNPGTAWKKIECGYGYVDMARLTTANVDAMYDSLKNTPAIIFDLRCYPAGTTWDIAKKILPDHLDIAIFSEPDSSYPGVIYYAPFDWGLNNNPNAYTGNVIMLVNEYTQSQAEYTAMMLSTHPNSKIMGSQTAGADGDISYMHIPGTVGGAFTTLRVLYPDFSPTQQIGIHIDTMVNYTIAGIRQGKDEVLLAALDCLTGVEHQETDITEVNVYPNPFSDQTTFYFSDAGLRDYALTIYDLFGRMVKEIPLNEKYTVIERGTLAAGIYSYTVSEQNERIASGKLIIQ